MTKHLFNSQVSFIGARIDRHTKENRWADYNDLFDFALAVKRNQVRGVQNGAPYINQITDRSGKAAAVQT